MVRIAIIGGGIYGSHLLKACACLEQQGLCKLTALADVDEAVCMRHAEQYGIATYTNYEHMLEKEPLDAVAIATPDFLHRPMTTAACEAGLHIFLEKPMDVTVEGCEAITAAAERAGILLEIDFHKRLDPANTAAAGKVRSGEFGRIAYGYAWVEDTIEVPSEWLAAWAGQSSPVWFIGIHAFDLLRWIIGSEPISVYAVGTRGKLQGMGIDTYDSVQSLVRFGGGSSVTFDAAWILPRQFPAIINQGYRLVGTEGILEVDSQNRGIEAVTANDARTVTPNPYFLNERRLFGQHPRYGGYGVDTIEDFLLHVKHILAGGSKADLEGYYASAFDGLQATRMAIAAHRSAETGSIVTL